jgi:hypothetical protein
MLEAITHHVARLLKNDRECMLEMEADRADLQARIEYLEDTVRKQAKALEELRAGKADR